MVRKERQFVVCPPLTLKNGMNGRRRKFVQDIMRFLDNVLEDFIKNAPDSMKHAAYSQKWKGQWDWELWVSQFSSEERNTIRKCISKKLEHQIL